MLYGATFIDSSCSYWNVSVWFVSRIIRWNFLGYTFGILTVEDYVENKGDLKETLL